MTEQPTPAGQPGDGALDAHLQAALAHAPEPATPPSPAVRTAVLAHARQALAPRRAVTKAPWMAQCMQWLGLSPGGGIPLAAALGSLFLTVMVGVMWSSDERRQRAQEREAPSAATAAPAPAPAPAPALATGPLPAAAPAVPAPVPVRALERGRSVDAAAKAMPQQVAVGPARSEVAEADARKELRAESTQHAPVVADQVGPASPATPQASAKVAESADVANVAGRLKKSQAEANSTGAAPAPTPAPAPTATVAAVVVQTPPTYADWSAGFDASLALLDREPWACSGPPKARCDRAAADRLLHAPQLREWLTRHNIIADAPTPTPSVTLRWQSRSRPDQVWASLVWEPGQRRLSWAAPGYRRTVQLDESDALVLQQSLDQVLQYK